MSELALKLIKEAKEKRLTRLDLGNCGLTELPDELFELVWLEELILSNYWFDFRFKKENFNPIKSQNTGKANNIKSFTPQIKLLNKLKTLIVSGQEYLHDLRPIKDLTYLEQLDISKTKVISLVSLKKMVRLRQLDISKTDVISTVSLKYLVKLQQLDASETSLININSLIRLKEIQKLNLSHTSIDDLTPLKGFLHLQQLDFSSTNVRDLNPIKYLNKLKYLNISLTQVRDLNPLKDLKSLQELFIQYTKVSDITPIEELKQLEVLNIGATNVNDLSPLKDLTGIIDLYIFTNKLNDLSPLKGLTQLQGLYAFETQISDLSSLKALLLLRELDLSNTDVSNLDSLENLLELKMLCIPETLVSDLRPLRKIIEKGRKVEFNQYGSIAIEGCPITNPPAYIVEQGNEAILRYWQELENKETITNNQTKLIFVGNSRAGKTSLWQFLKDKVYNDQADSTHGIKTEIWDKEPLGTEDNQNLAAHIWDFGGQEYYHATHRLFLADNAVYVLVWEQDSNKQGTRLEKFKLDDDPKAEIEEVELEHFPASYWLENIKYFAGKHCPVLIVQNKVDSDNNYCTHTEGEDESFRCFHISVKNAYNFQQGNQSLKRFDLKFQDFKETLLDVLRRNINPELIVKYYVQVREKLEGLSKSIEYITPQQLRKIALEFDETPDIENLLAYLSANSTILHFPKFDRLKERLYLNPTQVSGDIYKILNKQVQHNKGKFDFEHIQKRLNCDETEVERFIDLMKAFDLIFEKTNSDNMRFFVAPQYLLSKEKLGIDVDVIANQLRIKTAFYIRFYKFTPQSMLSRFIAHNGAASMNENYWKNGIIYNSKQTDLPIRVEFDHNCGVFKIEVQNKELQAIDMQNIVNKFVELDSSSENIEISLDDKTYIDLDKLGVILKRGGVNNPIYSANDKIIDTTQYKWLTQKIKTKETMTLDQLKEKVHVLIGKAKTKEAMDAVATWAHENNQKQLKDDINLLKGELTALDRQETLGLLSFQEIAREKAKLNNRLLSLMNGIEDAKVEEIIKDLEQKEEVKKKVSNKPLSVFISYSKRDFELKEELIIHLASLRRRNKAANWDDRHIIGGELWDDAIKTKLKEADIILFLVSASFIATDYIWDYEIPMAEEQRQNGKARVVPIILKPCQWTKLDFAKHQALPSKGIPISSFSDRDTAWLEVVEGIEKVINDVLK